MVGNIWDKDDARCRLREDAAKYGPRLFEISVAATLTGKTGRLKRGEKYYWHRSIGVLATCLGVPWGVPPPRKAPPRTEEEINESLSWAFLEFWPKRGVDMWLDDEFESFLEPDEDM